MDKQNLPAHWQFKPDPLLIPGRYAFVLEDEDQSQLLISELARRIHSQAQGALGILAAKPVLISNLRVWENLVLPSWYHSGASLAELDRRLQDFLAAFAIDHEQVTHHLSLLPAQLDTGNRRLVALLRALLQQPRFLVLEHEWLDWLAKSRERNTLLAQLFDSYTGIEYLFLIVSGEAPAGYTPVEILTEIQTEIA
ncbi:ATP-binding cassette domain-containing protein [Chitinibacter sp. S2-10]|uniref:ATP-binding cassette domain-containing protein n=1 Tax=Chitinibacter sp. S2-10 TaxID=3373597 RepID=UPI0039773830